MLKTVDFEILPATGPGSRKVAGSVRDLVLAIPYFMNQGLIPPRNALNSVLRTGKVDAGMSGGCLWKPFELSPGEYDDFVKSLSIDPTSRFTPAEVPEWVETQDDWQIWVMERVNGVPAEEHRRLSAE